MRTIILAAGQGYKLGNFNKLLLRCPYTNKTILDIYLDIFKDTEITIVVGYKAIQIMNEYPKLNYIYNQDWHISKDSHSLGLALNEEPSYIIHSDLFITDDVRNELDKSSENAAVALNRPDRTSSALNCTIEKNFISRIYQGDLINPHDPELIGIYKVKQKDALRYWKRSCFDHKNLLAGQNFPLNKDIPLERVNGDNLNLTIIKTPIDYINYINLTPYD